MSNLVNDDWGITRIITTPPYESSEHYKRALVNISGINYGRNLKLEDIESINQNNKAQDLERLLNSNSIISLSDSTITILNKYLNTQQIYRNNLIEKTTIMWYKFLKRRDIYLWMEL